LPSGELLSRCSSKGRFVKASQYKGAAQGVMTQMNMPADLMFRIELDIRVGGALFTGVTTGLASSLKLSLGPAH